VPLCLSLRAVARGLVAELGFRGALLTDGLRAVALAGVERCFARALRAGCHGLLGPLDPEAAAGELLGSAEDPDCEPRVSWLQLELASRRMQALAEALARRPSAAPGDGALHPGARPGADRAAREDFALACASAALCLSPGGWPLARGEAAGLEVLGASDALRRSLERALGASRAEGAGGLIAVCANARAIAPVLLERAGAARRARRALGVLWFAAPSSLPAELWGADGVGVLVAFAPTPPLVQAAAGFAQGRREAGGSLPVRVG
jgi:hypothetical protein